MKHTTFHYKHLDEVRADAERMGLALPLSEDTSLFSSPVDLAGTQLANRFSVQPMEGCDSTDDGTPTELTFRRYQRFARGGAGLLWMEAVAITPEGRANPHQLMLHEGNLDVFKRLVSEAKETALRENGFLPYLVMQATHSGRYSKPDGLPAPLIARHDALEEKEARLPEERVASDTYLKSLADKFAATARLAEMAGFDAVDIKACHRYLLSELLSAYDRPGPYGGSYENRTRLLKESIDAASAATKGDCAVTTRLNLYDGYPYPYGWGVDTSGGLDPVLDEPIRLVRELRAKHGIHLFNFTIGNPYFNPHVNRPYDLGAYVPPEHPLESQARVCRCIGEVKKQVEDIVVISSANSYLRQFSANMAAGMLADGAADIVGFGRMAFAYPDFAKDLMRTGALDPRQCCVACGKCTQLMRSGAVAGCVVRDSALYLPIYREKCMQAVVQA